MWAKPKQQAFTIVELLIVIVVVAILAAITVVAFNGVQQRAQNSARIAQAEKMYKYLRAYVALNGSDQLKAQLPVGGSPVTYCLGTGYVDVVEGSGVGCYVNSAGQSTSSSASLDSALQTVGNISVSSPRVTIIIDPMDPPIDQSAPTLTYVSSAPTFLVDGRPNVFGHISYILQGENVDCGARPMLVYQGPSGGNSLYTASNGARNSSYSSAGGGYTTCQLYFHPDA
jgi:prepilin-type N-terminal cleavage/methylation domain-containing protein